MTRFSMLWLQRKADLSLHARAGCRCGRCFFGALLFLCDLFLFGARGVRTSTTVFVATGQQRAAMMPQQKGIKF